MSSLLVIRIVPTSPMEAADFTNWLSALGALQITAFDLTYGSVTASPPGTNVGTATYVAASTPPKPLAPVPIPPGPPPVFVPPTYPSGTTSGIVQQYDVVPAVPGLSAYYQLQSVATAVIEIASPTTFENVRLAMQWGSGPGAASVPVTMDYYDVALAPGPSPDPSTWYTLPPSLYLTLPAPPTGATGSAFMMPADGSPPAFDALLDAVRATLADDPGGSPDIGQLDLEQCRNIAYEIVWSQQGPLPTPPNLSGDPNELGDMYTNPPNTGVLLTGTTPNPLEGDRRQFEGELKSYYAQANAIADRLTNFVYSLSAAVNCEEQSLAARAALLELPVNPEQPGSGPRPETEIILTGFGGVDPPTNFGVPAAYFYALAATMPPQLDARHRFQLATGSNLQRMLADLASAYAASSITDAEPFVTLPPATPSVNAAQAARRIAALNVPAGSTTPLAPLGTLALVSDSGTTAGNTLSFATTSGVTPGMSASGLNLVTDSTVTAVTPNSVTLSAPVTGAVPLGTSITFSPAYSADLRALVQSWLAFPAAAGLPSSVSYQPSDDATQFWPSASQAQPAAYLGLILSALTDGYIVPDGTPLGTEIATAPSLVISGVHALAQLSAQQWTSFFLAEPITWLPPFTAPGNQRARIAAFIRFVQQFFTAPAAPAFPPTATPPSAPQTLAAPSTDWLAAGLAAYEAIVGGGPVNFWSGGALDQAALRSAATTVFPGDQAAQDWLVQALTTIEQLAALVYPVSPPAGVNNADAWHFSLMEALYARGFTGPQDIVHLDADSFQQALTGTIAYDYAGQIYALAPATPPGPHSFVPVNPDGSLTNCIPPPCLSPLGPIEYLHQLLHLTEASTCEDPCPTPQGDTGVATGIETLGEAIASRRGPIGTLLASCANLETPLPLIDIVNENLEAIAAEVTAASPISGVVYSTAADSLAGHPLCAEIECEDGERERDTSCHDPATLFATRPEYSSPGDPVARSNGYEALKTDFSAPSLPYSQPLDVSRSYLGQLGTQRFDTMRAFRRDITEFVLDPSLAPPTFQAHLWRYPVRLEIAIESLGLSPEEFQTLFVSPLVASPWTLYGFAAATVNGTAWTTIMVQVEQFLKRTGLTYCEFLELWQAAIVPFNNASAADGSFPACQPCCPDGLTIGFSPGQDSTSALLTLATVIRLWHKLRHTCHGGYTFAQLADVLSVLEPLAGGLNAELVRQVAALCMLRERFQLPLTDPGEAQIGAGADRTHLLALWVGPSARTWPWAIAQLLRQVQRHAHHHFGDRSRPPEFIKLLADNLDSLSRLAGFDPTTPASSWHARPTATLRFAEVLAKIHASEFNVGELLFLFTAGEHLDGNDPFPLQEPDDALDLPLDLPESEHEHSLAALRRRLLDAEVSEDEAERWTWPRIVASLRDEFGYSPPSGADPLLSLGQHLFPNILEAAGQAVSVAERQYRVPLSSATPLMWNAPLDGPFRYDSAGGALWTQVPLRDEAVIAKLSHTRQLLPNEVQAVQDLYFLPRCDLAPFGFLFPDFMTADRHLIQEAHEHERWRYFQRHFALAHRRCQLIAEHLSHHVARATGRIHSDECGVAWRALQHLLADENAALTPWEADSGAMPAVTWTPQPNGGAFAALLGLLGTGLLGEFDAPAGTAIWREVRGPMSAFDHELNEANSPVPTVLPSMGLTLPAEQLRFIALQNGYALRDRDSAFLGGAEGFHVCWTGVLLVDQEGDYRFLAGAPTPDGERPSFEGAEARHWRVTLARGQKTWIMLDHQWPDEQEHEVGALRLKHGAYRLTIDLTQPTPDFVTEAAIHSQHTGIQLKYAGPDSAERWVAIPVSHLFRAAKAGTLDQGVQFPQTDQGESGAPLSNVARSFLRTLYTSSLRDIRRTYQRAFKAVLFAERFGLSAAPITDDRQSELGYMLANPGLFAGVSYYYDPTTSSYLKHAANFDFNFLPLLDNYQAPAPAQDDRVQPSPRREQALFDWWERTFDYARMRKATASARARPAWLLFHEAQEKQPSTLTPLLRHLDIDFRHAGLVLNYYDSTATDVYALSYTDLEDDRWAVRVWHAEEWTRHLLRRFACRNIAEAQPSLWVSDDPSLPLGTAAAGNANLTAFVENGSFENGRPRRYKDVQRLNDGLRVRARDALATYLCAMNRVPLPWAPGSFTQSPRDLSDLLLLDVEAGVCERASRIDEAITAVQTFVRRARLGLEPSWTVSHDFALLWDKRFATFRIWQRCERRHLYKENWIEWEELEKARRIEAFRFLESELRRTTLTAPIPGGLEWWPDERLPLHPSLLALQRRDPAELARLQPEREGLDLLGTQERGARPSWLAPLAPADRVGEGGGGDSDTPTVGGPETPGIAARAVNQPPPSVGTPQVPAGQLPLWMEAAIRLGKRFYRIAAAGDPQAAMPFAPHHKGAEDCCCAECGRVHPELLDEYYFWLVGTEQFDPPGQSGTTSADADFAFEYGYQDPYYDPAQQDSTPWQEELTLPGLLSWNGAPAVRLAWCRVHNGEFQQPRRSVAAVEVTSIADADLVFQGRVQDSLIFSVTNPLIDPVPGYDTSAPGFRYDIAADWVAALPLVAALPPPSPYLGDLPAYPFFVYDAPGERLFPWSPYSPALAVAGALRTHCRFESALKWYQLAYDPFTNDNTWTECQRMTPPTNGGDQPPGGSGNQPSGAPNQPPTQIEVAVRQPGCGQRSGGACCDSTDITHEQALDRSILLHYLETLLHWGDALMRRDSPEAFEQARLIFDTLGRILGNAPRAVVAADPGLSQSVDTFIAYYPPLNPRLLDLYEARADRLGLIHHCLDARRLRAGRPVCDMPYFGNDPIRDGWRTEDEPCADEETWCLLPSPYRFQFLLAKAQELAGRVQELGSALLAAFEKGDATYLESLRAQQERELLSLGVAVRQDQWRDADWQVQALQKTKAVSQANLLYYNDLILSRLNNNELQYQQLIPAAISLRSNANTTEGIGEGLRFIPDIVLGAAGFGGSPVDVNWLPLGTKIGGALEALARMMNNSAEITSMNASLDLTEAGWDRRLQEWTHQSQILPIEIEQIERQILGAERRRDQALRELNSQQRQLEHAAEVQDFLRDKFTAHDLSLWLQKETAALYARIYELALDTARQAQHAFNVERGDLTRHFISSETWDVLHEGLLAGERLQLDLQRMEKTYLDENRRDYELTKPISLRTHFPAAFLGLMRTGRCEIEIPEWMFDLDYPGQYLRRIKNVSLTIPCVVGPYTGVHCRLTLLRSSTRISPRLIPPAAHCCPDEGEDSGYLAGTDDSRIVRQYTALEAIATSSGQNDTGMFELNFHDDRYLPFEYQGAVSRWRIELPPENNYFDMDTLSDVILHLNYTAREGGERLRHAANEVAQRHVPGAGWRYFDLRQEFADAWQRFLDTTRHNGHSGTIQLRLSRGMFPFIPGHLDLSITGLALLFQAGDADGQAHRMVELRRGRTDDAELDGREFVIPCEASAEWPALYHGVLDANLGSVGGDGRSDYATLRFPGHAEDIRQVFLLCRYEPTPRVSTGSDRLAHARFS